MISILLKVRNTVPNSYINSSNRFNKTKSNKHKPARPLSCKGKPFTRAKLHEFLGNFLLDDDACEDTDIGIEDAIEVNEYEHNLLVNSTSVNNINPGDIIKLIYAPKKANLVQQLLKRLILNMN